MPHSDFLDYFDKVHGRTLRVAKFIPSDKMEWTYSEGKFTLGDIVRHLGNIERYMFAENAQCKPSRYPGHGREFADGYADVLTYFGRMHAESMAIFKSLSEADFEKKCMTPGDAPLAVWKWLRLMGEHEIHHRGQIYLYLGLLGVKTPPLYGLTEEEVKARSEASR